MIPLLQERLPELWLRLGEHIVLTGTATSLAIILGLPLGILAARNRFMEKATTGIASILQTIPSLAMLAFLLAILNRIGFTPAIIALTLYALLPIIRGTLTGFQSIPEATNEAALGVGMNPRQRLWLVELPLALPSIVTGIRTAAVIGVGIATLSAFIGAGGLGQFINRGLSLSNHQLILLGAVPSALLALLIDSSIGAVHWAIAPKVRRQNSPSIIFLRRLALSSPILIFVTGWLATAPFDFSLRSDTSTTKNQVIRIGAKNFTEQLILGELMAQLIERHSELTVERTFDLGGTMICHEALVAGEIDLYAEYSGTALTAILKQQGAADTQKVFDTVASAYADRFDLHWLPPFGFNNTYAIAVRVSEAESRAWATISDLKPYTQELKAGWTFEFSERPDGYPGLKNHYAIEFGQLIDLEASLMYQAITQGEVDVICAFSTDGRIVEHDLRVLQDDKHFFPPYEAAPVIRRETLRRHPHLETILTKLSSQLDDQSMRRLNGQVDIQKLSPKKVASAFLDQLGL